MSEADILVSGATGRTGGAAIDTLLGMGKRVRAYVRSDDERAAAREKIAAISNPARGMSDAELAATIARLKDERAAIAIPHDVERRRKKKREEIERYEQDATSVTKRSSRP